MLVSAVVALYAFVSAVGVVLAADPATQHVKAWRRMGFTFFMAIFVLLAFWPRRYPYLWELVILSKGTLSVIEALLVRVDAKSAPSSAVVDGLLTLILIGSYLLSRGYRSWGDRHA